MVARGLTAPSLSHAVIAVRFVIVPRGRQTTDFGTKYRVNSVRHCRKAVNVTSVLGAPAERSTLGEIAWRVACLAKPCWQECEPVKVARKNVAGRTASGAIAARQGPHVSPL